MVWTFKNNSWGNTSATYQLNVPGYIYNTYIMGVQTPVQGGKTVSDYSFVSISSVEISLRGQI